jgi:mannose-1-phosphate guanylyltransferase
MPDQHEYAVIMAGGVGTRLWPRSRESHPKQLLHLMGDGTMIQNTVARLQPLVPPERILIVTNETQVPGVRDQIPSIPDHNIIAEPFGRNTAPCIGLAATILNKRDPNAVMIVLPADHWIENVREFQNRLRVGLDVAQAKHGLVTLGIQPNRPETGYGYIQWKEDPKELEQFAEQNVRTVRTFAEKPDRTTAQRFLESGDFLWNSGMFIWRTDVILGEFERYLPDMHKQLCDLGAPVERVPDAAELEQVYRHIVPISIDYGIMEKAKNVFVLSCDFGWSDVGSWDETFRLSRKDKDGNSMVGDVFAFDTENSFVRSNGRMIATIGMKDVIVVDSDDALLVCHSGESQNVQKVVDYLRRKKITKLL